MSTGSIVTLAVIAVFIVYLIAIYNNLVAYRNKFKNGFANIDNQLQLRYDLIPNLIETAKAYMGHEKETLTRVIEARNKASASSKEAALHPEDAAAMKKLAAAETALSGSMLQFFALTESYPDIKANQTMEKLMEELSTVENKVAFSRQRYNDDVMHYNTYREQFPNFIVANNGGFKEAALFEIENEEYKKPLRVDFN